MSLARFNIPTHPDSFIISDVPPLMYLGCPHRFVLQCHLSLLVISSLPHSKFCSTLLSPPDVEFVLIVTSMIRRSILSHTSTCATPLLSYAHLYKTLLQSFGFLGSRYLNSLPRILVVCLYR